MHIYFQIFAIISSQTGSSDGQAWIPIMSAVLGAAVGALLGALTTYFIGNRERDKQLEIAKFDRQRNRFLENNRQALGIETALNSLLINVVSNQESFDDLAQGIFNETTRNAILQLNLPVTYTLNKDFEGILNGYLLNRLNNLTAEIEMQNKGILDFNSYYSQLRSHIISMLIKGKKPDLNNLMLNNQVIKLAIDGEHTAAEVFKNKTLHISATLNLFFDWYTQTNTRNFKASSEFIAHIDAMMAWEPNKKALDVKIKALSKQYVSGQAFKSTRKSAVRKN
jgi:hypothetical protein